MSLSSVCISRPVFAIVINLILVIIGIVGFDRLSVRQLPHNEQFTVNIATDYPGASADLIEEQITTRVEDALAGIEGIDVIMSTSRQGRSDVAILFQPNYDVKEGMNDVRDQLGRVRRGLPDEAEDPVLVKADPNADPTLFITFDDEKRDALALTDYVNRYVKPSLEKVQGVGRVQVFGKRDYAMRIWLDPLKMASRHVTTGDIENTLNQQNTRLPVGVIESQMRDYTVLTNTKINRVEEFQNLIVRDEDGKTVRLSDIAQVEIGPQDLKSVVRVNGKSAVVLAIVPQATANPVDVSSEVSTRLAAMQKALPTGMQAKISFDTAIFISESIHEVYKTIIEAIVLVILVVFAFLASMRSAIIPIVTIPLCLVGTFGVLYFLGYTINTMTLLAVVLAIGLVVDDAIVMVENIYRHIESGLKPVAAAIKGSQEITFAIIAMTLTLAAVYAPIGFTQGLTGNIFREFAFTLAGAVILSGFVALTLSPMMCAYLLRSSSEPHRYETWLNQVFERLNQGYKSRLVMLLHYRRWVLLGSVTIGLLGIALFVYLKKELAPIEDTGAVIVVTSAPTGSNFAYMDAEMQKVEAILSNVKERTDLVAVIGSPSVTRGMLFMGLQPWSEREKSQTEIVQAVQPQLFGVPGLMAFAIDEPPISSRGGNNPVELVVQIAGSYEDLADIMDRLVEAVKTYPGVSAVESDLRMNSQQFEITVNRDLAANLGVTLEDINNAINVTIAGRNITDFDMGGKSYPVLVQVPNINRMDAHQIESVYVRSKNDTMIPLSQLVSIKEVLKAETLPHYNRFRAAQLTANLNPGYSLGEVIAYLEQLAPQVLPEHVQFQWEGLSRDFIDASGDMIMTVLLALLFIYLVLSAQFESFKDPLVIMLTVPFSIIGALIFLHLTGGSNNIYTQIGFVTLIGLITKHGILIVDFANKLRDAGRDIQDAIVTAAMTRLRPILMTTGAMVLGALPLAFANGAGAIARQQLGWVIVGGMSFGTLFSLVIVPVAYYYLNRKRVVTTE